jgi:hypothetical protein
VRLTIHEVRQDQATHLLGLDLSDGSIPVDGLREASRYSFSVVSDLPLVAYIDDMRLEPQTDSSWVWDSGFCIGAARLELTDLQGRIVATVVLNIASDDQKLCQRALQSLLDNLLAWAPEKIIGQSQTWLLLAPRGQLVAQVLFERIRRYGPAFCEALNPCQSNPHSTYEARARQVPVDRVRRPSRHALSGFRVVGYIDSMGRGVLDQPAPVVRSERLSLNLDTLANRSLLTLAKKVLRVVERVKAMQDATYTGAVGAARSQSRRRIQILDGIAGALRKSIKWFLRAGVGDGQDLADGLGQMLRMPPYARALRFGKLACSESFDTSEDKEAELPLNSSWGLYEQWCFEQVRLLIERRSGIPAVWIPRLFGADTEAYVFQGQRTKITLVAQMTFPSGAALVDARTQHSLSKERRPDIILLVEDAGGVSWYIFDAKYRQSKANVLDAMSSAHIYRDSLFLNGERCNASLLLTPGSAFDSGWTIFTQGHWDEFSTGIVPDFRPEGAGLTLMEDLIGRAIYPIVRDPRV